MNDMTNRLNESGIIPNAVQESGATAEKTGSDIIEAIKARPTYDTEDWLIIITSDHGGYNVEHGGTTMQERYTFIAANKDLTGYIPSSPIC